MPMRWLRAFAARKPAIDARRVLDGITAASAPHLKPQGRRDLINRLRRQAQVARPRRDGTVEDLRAIGIEVVDA